LLSGGRGLAHDGVLELHVEHRRVALTHRDFHTRRRTPLGRGFDSVDAGVYGHCHADERVSECGSVERYAGVRCFGNQVDRQPRNASIQVSESLADEIQHVLGIVRVRVAVRSAIVGERRDELPEVLFAEGDVVLNSRGSLDLEDMPELVERVAPATGVLVALRLSELLACGLKLPIGR
jgi:hypothetical protein